MIGDVYKERDDAARLVRAAREHLGDDDGKHRRPAHPRPDRRSSRSTRLASTSRSQRGKDGAKAGHKPGHESSILKLLRHGAEPAQARAARAHRSGRKRSGGKGPGSSRRRRQGSRATGCDRAATPSRAARPRSSSTSSPSACSACRAESGTAMDLVLSEEQKMLQRAARTSCRPRPPQARRAARSGAGRASRASSGRRWRGSAGSGHREQGTADGLSRY